MCWVFCLANVQSLDKQQEQTYYGFHRDVAQPSIGPVALPFLARMGQQNLMWQE